ncbi:MAG: Appr-1-p processing protein [Deltaproteobacteria bacterium CG2_30_63_29]|nr:MAG: Appr-1-p processing protein [Deltaproteobacteria bacterium CG2_30_63_29]PIV99682.1 MAG: Appr-1-p processing protein [Deltaproteobacteria bacterium CG17_big_fil_post_rev_8_21_14_2_50_63_7]
MTPTLVTGDLLEQPVEVIVNAWNRNIIPWWLLIPAGVAGAIRRQAGTAPFKELAKTGPLPLGAARLTGAGRLPFKGIIHVAGISMWWVSSERSIRDSTRNALRVAQAAGIASLAYPIIGGGTGGTQVGRALDWMLQELEPLDSPVDVTIVSFAGRA